MEHVFVMESDPITTVYIEEITYLLCTSQSLGTEGK